LSKPVVDWFSAQTSAQKIHLVQPNSLIVNNFKFELQEALKKGEKVYWIQPNPSPIEDLSNVPATNSFNPLLLQSSLNKLSQSIDKEHIELYFINNQELAQGSKIFVPSTFSLHTVVDSTKHDSKPYLAFGDNKLFVNAANILMGQSELDKKNNYTSKPVNDAAIQVLILNDDKAEKRTISASLKALEEVYKITLTIDTEPDKNKKYNWVFSDKPLKLNSEFVSESTLQIISNTNHISIDQLNYQKNIIQIPYSLNPQSSAAVFNGELPEWLGETMVKHYQLNPVFSVLSNQQLQGLFTYSSSNKITEDSEFSRVLILAFIIILGIERYIALSKNA